MTTIWIVCGITSCIMLFLFFVIPGIDRRAREREQASSPRPETATERSSRTNEQVAV